MQESRGSIRYHGAPLQGRVSRAFSMTSPVRLVQALIAAFRDQPPREGCRDRLLHMSGLVIIGVAALRAQLRLQYPCLMQVRCTREGELNSGSPVLRRHPVSTSELSCRSYRLAPQKMPHVQDWTPRSMPHVLDAPEHAPCPLGCCSIDGVTTNLHFPHAPLGRFSKLRFCVATRQQAGAGRGEPKPAFNGASSATTLPCLSH